MRRDPETGEHTLGIRVLSLGGQAMQGMALRELAMPILRQLVETTRLGAHLAILGEQRQQHESEDAISTLALAGVDAEYGALDALRSCVAILYTKQGRIAMAITVDEMPDVVWTVDNPGYLLMARLSSILADELKTKTSAAK